MQAAGVAKVAMEEASMAKQRWARRTRAIMADIDAEHDSSTGMAVRNVARHRKATVAAGDALWQKQSKRATNDTSARHGLRSRCSFFFMAGDSINH